MKKVLILFLSFFIFSCSQKNIEKQEILTWKTEEKQEILTWKIQEEKTYKELQNCIEKSPFNGVFSYLEKPKIYWTFKNNWKCFYLWFANNFFLIDENPNKDLFFEYTNKLYREEALDDKFWKVISEYWLKYIQELPPIYLFYPKTLDIFKKYLKKENIILPEEYILVEKNKVENFKNELNMMKENWQEHSNQELNIKETLDLDLENLYQTLVNLQNK